MVIGSLTESFPSKIDLLHWLLTRCIVSWAEDIDISEKMKDIDKMESACLCELLRNALFFI